MKGLFLIGIGCSKIGTSFYYKVKGFNKISVCNQWGETDFFQEADKDFKIFHKILIWNGSEIKELTFNLG